MDIHEGLAIQGNLLLTLRPAQLIHPIKERPVKLLRVNRTHHPRNRVIRRSTVTERPNSSSSRM